MGYALTGDAHLDATRQLIRVTSIENALRADTEQAARLADALPVDLPLSLRTEIRNIMDQRVGYVALESELVNSAAGRLDDATVNRMLEWHVSAVGQVLSQAESSAYASLFELSAFGLYHNPPPKPAAFDSRLVDQVLASDHFLEFANQLSQGVTAALSCIPVLLQLNACSTKPTDAAKGPLSQHLADSARDAVSRVPAPDLNVYLDFLRVDQLSKGEVAIQIALVEVERHAWQDVVSQIQAAIDHYAASVGGPAFKGNLEEAKLKIDRGEGLTSVRFMLLLLQRAAPSDPAVLVQLARVTLKLAPDAAAYDIDPSVPIVDAADLKAAQGYLDQALAIAPERAETLMLLGHLAYLQRNFSRSVELLRQARSRGGDSPWLAVNLGDAEWALAFQPPAPNQELMRQAAAEFEAALKQALPGPAKERALHQLTAIYPLLGDNRRADALHRQYLSMQHGNYAKARALHRYSEFQLLAAHDLDGAVTSAEAAQELEDNSVYRTWLAEALLVRGDWRFDRGKKAKSADDFAAAGRLQVDLESLCPGMAMFPGTFPGVFGLHDAGVVTDFSGSLGGNALIAASRYAGKGDIEKLLKWGANPNYFSAEQGAPLHVAILGDNIEGVKVLLAHGADPALPFVDGRLPSQLGGDATDDKRPEILKLVEQASRGRAGPIAMPPGSPFTANHRYRLKRPLESDARGDYLPANWEFVYLNICRREGDDTVGCYLVHDPHSRPGSWFGFTLDQAQIRQWKDWFEDLGAAAEPSANDGQR
jgi:tetratricopeptide (TPR) repeat protein